MKCKKLLQVVTVILSLHTLQSQSIYHPIPSTSSFAAGINGIANPEVGNVFLNPALHLNALKTSIECSAQQYFTGTGIFAFQAGGYIPLASKSHFICSITQFTLNSWNEQDIRLGFGRVISDKFQLGVALGVHRVDIQEYGSKSLFTGNVGMQVTISPSVQLAFTIQNPPGIKYPNGDKLPMILQSGLHYGLSKHLKLFTEVEQDFIHPLNIRFGMHYLPIERMQFMFGFQSLSKAISGGFQYAIQEKYQIALGTSYHTVLGFSNSGSFTIAF